MVVMAWPLPFEVVMRVSRFRALRSYAESAVTPPAIAGRRGRRSRHRASGRLGRRGEPHRRELLGAADAAGFGRARAAARRPRRRDGARSAAAPFSRSRRARSLTTSPATCGMRAAGVPGRGENGNTCRCVSPHSSTRSSERANIVLGLGREAGDDVGAEHHVGPQPPHLLAERDRVGAQMPPLHALEDQVVAGLQRQMQMRHQPRLVGERIEQVGVGLDRVDRREPQPLAAPARACRICFTSVPSFGAPGRSAP